MTTALSDALVAIEPEGVTSRLLRGIYGVVPYSPEFPHYRSIDDAVRALDPGADAAAMARARDIAGSDPIADTLWMANLLDSADAGYAVFTGVFAAVNHFWRKREDAFETDDQQRNDAIIKLLGISYMVYKAFPGSLADKARAFRKSPSGQAISIYYGAVEVGLPFADNVATAGAGGLDRLLGDRVDAQVQRLAGLAAGRDVSEAKGMMSALTEPIGKVVGHTAKHVDKVAEAARPYLPGVAHTADRTAGLLANAADILPVYRVLGARLGAEAAAWRALYPSGHGP